MRRLLTALGLAATCIAPPAPHAAAATALDWKQCGDLQDQIRECSSLPVPLDYSDPSGPTIALSLARIPARGPGPKLGTILVDPGGPGISGVDEILTLPYQLSPEVEARYDVIGWDRRGVARSSPIWWRRGLAGDGTALVDLGGLHIDPDSAPSNRFNALYAINCYDSTPTPDVAGSARLAAQWDADTPIFGSANAWGGLRCSSFPTHDPVGPQRVRGEGAAPVVVVGALKDGATPVHWSEALADQLVSARLVVADTDVHSVYPTYNACVVRIVDAYLLEGTAPPRRSDCPAD